MKMSEEPLSRSTHIKETFTGKTSLHSKDSLQIYCRIKDSLDKESMLTIDTAQGYTELFHENTPQSHVFNSVCVPLIEEAFRGRSGLLIAYGTPSTGKSYTILGHPKDKGLIPKTIAYLSLQKVKYSIQFYEIHEDNLYDLLCPTEKPPPLHFRQDGSILKVIGITQKSTSSPRETAKLLSIGLSNRKNLKSHLIFSFCFPCANLFILDSASYTMAKQRDIYVPHSLETLRLCLCLSNWQPGHPLPPFRNSTLTKTLSGFFSLNSRNNISIILHVSSDEKSLSVLHFPRKGPLMQRSVIIDPIYSALCSIHRIYATAQETVVMNYQTLLSMHDSPSMIDNRFNLY